MSTATKFALAVGMFGLAQCASAAPAYYGAGTVQVNWTISGSANANLCGQSGATTLSVSVNDGNNVFVGNYQASCVSFATSIALTPGTYSAYATLLNGGGQPVTTTVSITPFAIISGTNVLRVIDFPSNSFLN